jgi:hypothetical protein
LPLPATPLTSIRLSSAIFAAAGEGGIDVEGAEAAGAGAVAAAPGA